jgi:glyoxylase-like metal-dependent hydrolase (beta-lactamase superfamily II)
MYVGSPGGHLGQYLASLERLRALPIRLLYPAHGPPTLEAAKLLDRTLAHRRERLEEIAAALDPRTPRSVEDIAGAVYRDTDPRLAPLYVRTTRAALEHLAEKGRAQEAGPGRYRLPGA